MKVRTGISVVIPTYNASQRLKRTIETVLAQTAPPLEIIIVDDGSTDDTRAVCAKFGRLINYMAIPNGGQQIARNYGVQRATGDWIALLDHDDIWHPDYLAEVNALHRTHEFDLAFCNSQTLQENGTENLITVRSRFTDFTPAGYWERMGVTPTDRWSILERYNYNSYLAYHPAQPSVMTIRKALYQSLGGYDPRMRGSSAENFEFEIRALRVARVGLIWRPLVTITRHALNASVNGSKTAMDVVDCLRFALQHHALTQVETAAIEAELQRCLPAAVNSAFTLRQFKELRVYQEMSAARADLKTRIKYNVARLPRRLANVCADVLERRSSKK